MSDKLRALIVEWRSKIKNDKPDDWYASPYEILADELEAALAAETPEQADNEPVARYDELCNTVILLCDPEFSIEQRKNYVSHRSAELKAAITALAQPASPGQEAEKVCNGPFGDEESCPVHGEEVRRARGRAPSGASETSAPLAKAIAFAENVGPLPRCPHGKALKDGAGELLEPSCGCRFAAPAVEAGTPFDEWARKRWPLATNLRFHTMFNYEEMSQAYAAGQAAPERLSEEKVRKLATEIVNGPPAGHPWWRENDDRHSNELEIEWVAEKLRAALRQPATAPGKS